MCIAVLQVIVPKDLTNTELVSVLEPISAAKYLHFTDITAVFNGSFANPNHRIEYERWLDQVVQPWCCKTAAAAAADGSSSGLVEVATRADGWVSVGVKARPGGGSSSSSSSDAG